MPKYSRITNKDIMNIRRDRRSGISSDQIAKNMNISVSTVYKHTRDIHQAIKKEEEEKLFLRNIEIKKMAEEGREPVEIAEKLNLSKSHTRSLVKKLTSPKVSKYKPDKELQHRGTKLQGQNLERDMVMRNCGWL